MRSDRTVRVSARALLTAAFVAGCASQGGAVPPARSTPPAAVAPAPALTPSSDASRSLGPDATFADLVRAARVLAKQGAEPSARCLLSEAAPGYRLDADVLTAIDPIPDPPAELDVALQNAPGSLAVLSAWGVLGAPEAALVLMSFTATPPQRLRAVPSALLLTENGVYVRSAARASSEADGPLPPAGAIELLQSQPELGAGPLFVSAEAAVPLSAVAALLQAVPPERAVALAIALPAGTRLPPSSGQLGALACPDGLPEPAADRAEGEIGASALGAALRAVVPDAERCLSSARGSGRAGGTLNLALRIDAAGSTEHVCALGGELRDPALVACVLEVVRGARFPPPVPGGFVDVHAPLRLEPMPWPEPRPYCPR